MGEHVHSIFDPEIILQESVAYQESAEVPDETLVDTENGPQLPSMDAVHSVLKQHGISSPDVISQRNHMIMNMLDTEEKLRVETGINSFALLNALAARKTPAARNK